MADMKLHYVIAELLPVFGGVLCC